MVWSVTESRRSEERLPKAAQRVNAVNQFTELADKIGLSGRKTKFGGGKRETPLHG